MALDAGAPDEFRPRLAVKRPANAPVPTGVSGGAAGIGFFFLRLNHVTRNPAYLCKARRAADYIASTQHPSDAASELVQNPEFAAPVTS